METASADPFVAAVRQFSRFYTRRVGVLGETMLASPFSLTEARVLYELASRDQPTAAALCADLGLDPGYLSRILARFTRDRLIERKPSAADGRRNLISLTAKGRAAFAPLEARSQADAAALLAPLPESGRQAVIGAMLTIERLIDRRQEGAAPYLLRPPHPGDYGWIVSRHGSLYAQERGWNEQFEALCAEIVAAFVRSFDPARERCWIAERDGENVGSVFVARQSDRVAKLRLLLVDPKARGLGIGARLVDECLRFARGCGYRKMTLWTQSNLTAARRIYAKAGFKRVKNERHVSFGHRLTGEYWELML